MDTRHRLTRLIVLAVIPTASVLWRSAASGQEPEPVVQLPAPAGIHRVGTTVFHWTDASRLEAFSPEPDDRREVMAQLWYPTGDTGRPAAPYIPELEALRDLLGPSTVRMASSVRTNSALDAAVSAPTAPHPVVVVSHGLGSRRSYYTIMAEELASHGYVVVGIDHPYGAGSVAFPDGRVIGFDPLWNEVGPPERSIEERNRFTDSRVEVWGADAAFALDQLAILNLAGPLRGAFDLDRAAVVGHSVGGKAAVAACMLDPRFKACVNLDGWPMPAQVEVNGLEQPFMLMEDLRDVTEAELESFGSTLERYARNMRDLQARKERIFARMKSTGYQVVIPGIRHAYFGDLPFVDPGSVDPDASVAPADALRIIHDYLLAFLDEHLRGRRSALLHPSAHLRTFGAQQYRNRNER